MAHCIELLDVGHVLVNNKIVPVLEASAATWSGGERHEPHCVRAGICGGVPAFEECCARSL
jgi:hypothetical protein